MKNGKTKQIMGVLGEQIVNTINYSASINAAFIARVFNLTPPIVPPTIRFQQPVKQMMPAGKSKNSVKTYVTTSSAWCR